MTITQPLDWNQIDTARSQCFIDYLDTATAQTEMQRYKQKTYDLVGAKPDAVLLDVGCGTGEDAVALAERVGSGGEVIGVDYSAALIEEACTRVASRDLSLTFQVGDAHHLAFNDNRFDGCRSDRLFMHLERPQQALAEMIRVTRPGGRILVREPDWETLTIDHRDIKLTHQILTVHFTKAIRHRAIGRELYRLFRQAGLEGVAVADTSTLILTDFATANRLYGLEDAATEAMVQLPESREAIAAWRSDLQQSDRAGTFFSAVTGFTVVGCKPEKKDF